MKIREYIADLEDAGYVSEAQDIEDLANDVDSLDEKTEDAGGKLRAALEAANRNVYCPLSF